MRITNKSYALNSFDYNGKISQKWFDLFEFNKNWKSTVNPLKSCFFNYQDEVRFWNYFNDTIFSIKNNEVYPHIIMQSEHPLESKDITRIGNKIGISDPRIMKELMNVNKYYSISNYLENNLLIYFWWKKGFRAFNIIYNKKNNSFIKTFLKDDITHLLVSPFEFCTETYFINCIRGQNDLDVLTINNNNSLSSKWKNKGILDRIKIGDNPVVLLYKLK